MSTIKFSVSPATIILFICMIATTPPTQLIACILSACIHECGHIVAAKALSIDLSHMKLDVLGARLTTAGRLYSYPCMIALCLAGPLVNLLCFVLTLPFCAYSDWILQFSLSSLALGLMNLIPIEGFDGGRTVHGLLCAFMPVSIVERVCTVLSFASLFLMWLFSVWMILRTGTTLTLFVFSCCLFGMLFV